ncbi:rhomboid family intramembrane serine protease [Sorangium sp. So ce367]|uniref:rhomboid family intramembrane serine protease n=1 Tax=Sorangium sp. So ce367 TaxID=3133305 RepID=UPI003F615050
MRPEHSSMGFPKPGKALLGMMIAIGCIWVMFTLGLNWGGAGEDVLRPFLGISEKVLHGQVWRLLTAPLVHSPSNPWHFIWTLLGLYFFGTSLEERWGAGRMVAFLFGSAAFAFALQVAVGAILPQVEQPVFYGGFGMVGAVSVAWALAHRHATVRLFFVIPVTGTMLLVFIFAISVFYVISKTAPPPEGQITPFGAMLAGYLFGDFSPLRRFYLRMRFRQLQAQSAALRRVPAARGRSGGVPLRVIPGGQKDPPKDKRFLN